MLDCLYIFVYGTLRDQSVNHMAHFLVQNCNYLSRGEVKGKLYKITWYPAIVLNESETHKVQGEVYEIPFATSEAIIHELDGYEGIYSNNESSDEYERVLAKVLLGSGKEIECWVYNYKASIENASWIESGDFIKFLAEKK